MSSRKAIKGKQLYRILFFGVIFMVLAVGTLAFWGVCEFRHDAAVVAVESSARGLSGAVTVLMDAVVGSNGEIGAQVFADSDPGVLRHQALRMLKEHQTLKSVMVSDDGGLRYSLVRSPEGIVETVVRRDTGGTVRVVLKNDGATLAAKPMDKEQLSTLDAALADEFCHLEPGQVNWRSPYGVLVGGESWLAASVLVQSGVHRSMVSFGFPVEAIVSRLGGAEKGSAEKVFLYWDSGKVLPISAGERELGQGYGVGEIRHGDAVDDPVVAGAARRLALDGEARKAPFSYTVNGEVWWGYVLPLSVFGDTMSLGVAVPRRNVVSILTGDTFLMFFGGALVLLAAAVLLVLRRNKVRIEAIGVRHKTPRSEQDVLRLIAEGESGVLEFKQTLRFNLKSGKNGKEIEHASLKTVAGFLNSEGGILLVGVADNGVVAGFDEDRFENADKALLHFNNLVNRAIGTEFARYLDSSVVEVQGKPVLAVHCLPAPVPAFLDTGKGEEFYVRSGPASRQLTFGQFYDWLKNH